jgi:hypothetical protein
VFNALKWDPSTPFGCSVRTCSSATVVASILPAINEVPEPFPAVVLWCFRVESFGMQLAMWTTLGLVFGALTERAWIKGHVEGRQTLTWMTA